MEIALNNVAQQALKHWQIKGDLSLIKHRENAVYRLNCSNGKSYALRLHRPGYHNIQSLDSELKWMQALNTANIHTPTVIPNTRGENISLVYSDDLEIEYQVDLLSWIDAKPLGRIDGQLPDQTDEVAQLYTKLGQLAAQIHQHSSGWQAPKNFQRHAWNLEGLVGNQPLWGKFWQHPQLNSQQRELIAQVRARLTEELSQLSTAPQHFGLLHADLVPENVLNDNGKLCLIDFDDSGWGWYGFELATILYFIQTDPHYAEAKQALLQAYCRSRKVDQHVIERQLPLFLAARGFTYLGWLQDRYSPESAELTPMLISLCCHSCEQYLKSL